MAESRRARIRPAQPAHPQTGRFHPQTGRFHDTRRGEDRHLLADSPGKRELPPELFTGASVFCDLPEQARRLGESRHAPKDTALTPLGEVLTGRAAGRGRDSDVTIFDSSGIGLQDLYLGLALLEKMEVAL
ncbi:hypothetical protein [Streptomyces sp. NPDC058249]|uniref:hypothetical protein n=1 Tax=Streptomyces sp. NPDC058249 TaxID=3346403 RepID=UPI0036ECA1B7